MNVDNLLNLRDHLVSQNAILSFNGILSQPLLVDMGKALRNHVAESGGGTTAKVRDVFEIFIEQTQNIEKYARSSAQNDTDETFLKKAIIVISDVEDGYTISSGNPIYRGDVDALGAHLDQINAMGRPALRKYYKQLLREARNYDATGGAGIGLIDMLRRAQGGFAWRFVDIDDAYMHFVLSVTV